MDCENPSCPVEHSSGDRCSDSRSARNSSRLLCETNRTAARRLVPLNGWSWLLSVAPFISERAGQTVCFCGNHRAVDDPLRSHWSNHGMLSLPQFAGLLIAMSASVALAQSAVEGHGPVSADKEDEVDELVRELRARKEPERPVGPRSIDVYATHYMIGERRFDSLDDLLDYIKDAPPDQFPIVSLKECSALAQAQELVTAKAELDLTHIRRLRDAGQSRLFQAGHSSPRECRWRL